MQTVRQWLHEIGLSQYADAFERNAIEPDLLPDLTDDDLEKLGVSALGHRKKLLKAIADLRATGAGLPLRSPDTYTPKHLAEKILTSKITLEGERKQVTVLFADLQGSMELLADRDPESARQLLDPVLEHMMEAVHRFEGTVNQVMGDGIMALFGAPIAHEDHAVRACYAALRMQEKVKQYAQGVRRTEAVSVQIRVGLNSGEVVVRAIGNDLHMDYTAVGHTTHLAARMEQLATPGSTLVTANTLRLAEGFVRVAPLGPVNVKGVTEPVEVYELEGAGTARTRLQAAALRGLTRFVGRDAEVEHLGRALGQAGAGHVQVVAIVGEAGVGKSRLVYEFVHSHRVQGWLTLEAASASYGRATSYLPVIGLLKSYFKIDDRDDHRQMREKVIGKLLTLDESLRSLVPPLLALLDVAVDDPVWRVLDPPHRKQRTLDAVKRLLLRESQVQPLLVFFEDLHWIDGETQALLDSLVEGLGFARLMILVSYRPEYVHRWGNKTAYSQLRLDSLPVENASQLLGALLGSDPGLVPLTAMLVKRGNPFYLEETVRTLVETGTLAGERGAYHLTRPVEGLQVPATVQTMLEARIDRLPAEEKQLLQAASVIGMHVPHPLLAAVMDRPEEALRRQLSHLQEAEFIYETQLFPDLEYSFKHALTCEVGYSSLLRDRRRQVHAQIVAAIEQLHADRLGEHVERLAHHAAGGQLWDRALRYGHLAGARAFDRSAAREALIHFEQARAALEQLPESPEHTRRLVDICFDERNALFALGDFVRMGTVLGEAQTLAGAMGDQRRLGWALAYFAHRCSFLCEHTQAIEAGERARTTAEAIGDTALLVVANYYLGQALWFSGDPRRGTDPLRAAIALLEGASPSERYGMTALSAVVVRWALAEVLAEQGSFDEAIVVGEEGLRIANTTGHRQSEVYARYGMGYAYLRRGEFAAAGRILEPSLALCRELEIRVALPFVAASLGAAYAGSGRAPEAVTLLEEALEAFTRMEILGLRSLSATFLGEAYLAQGRDRDALVQAERALSIARMQGERAWEAWALKLLGTIYAREPAGVPDAGRDRAALVYREALVLATELGMQPLAAHLHLDIGKLCLASNQREAGREHIANATASFREMGMSFWLEPVESVAIAREGT
ncbi:MAG: AAA family ATPase [Burkholderiales bacterium]|nr:AAA family ATPase [Burkholderiales bacterium]